MLYQKQKHEAVPFWTKFLKKNHVYDYKFIYIVRTHVRFCVPITPLILFVCLEEAWHGRCKTEKQGFSWDVVEIPRALYSLWKNFIVSK